MGKQLNAWYRKGYERRLNSKRGMVEWEKNKMDKERIMG